MRLPPDEYRLVLTGHHILMDGWSTPVLVPPVARSLCQSASGGFAAAGDALPRLSALDCGAGSAAALAAWREALAGLEEPTRPAADAVGRAPLAPEQVALTLSPTLTAALNRQARGRATLKHLHPGGVGDFAGAADRPRRRGVRHDGSGAAFELRHREQGGAVHQHAAAAGSWRSEQPLGSMLRNCRTGSRR